MQPAAAARVDALRACAGSLESVLRDRASLPDDVGAQLDLASAYIDMGDNDSARDILGEVIEEGNDQQKQEAKGLVEKIA